MTRLTDNLLKRAHAAAVRHNALNAKLTSAFNERYGCTYSDVDADWIIDSLDYGSGSEVTVEQCDQIMTDAGRPPVTSQVRGDRPSKFED